MTVEGCAGKLSRVGPGGSSSRKLQKKNPSWRDFFDYRNSGIRRPRHVVPRSPFGFSLRSNLALAPVRFAHRSRVGPGGSSSRKLQKKNPSWRDFFDYRNSGIRRPRHVVPRSPFGFSLRSNLALAPVRFAHRSRVGPGGSSSRKLQKKNPSWRDFFDYRNSGIRTHDLLLPKQALYQAELYSGDAPILEKFSRVRKGYFKIISFSPSVARDDAKGIALSDFHDA